MLGQIDPAVVVNVIVIPIAMLIGGAVVWVVNWQTNLRKANRGERKEDEETAIRRYEKLMGRLDRDREECRKENEQLREETTEARLLSERAITWIRYLESSLDTNKIPYRNFDEINSTES